MTDKNKFIFKDIAIQLVTINSEGQFEVTTDGFSFLSSLKNKQVSVVSLAGPYRSGKSFLANMIMNNMSGFKTGSTINACTRGIWVWGRPYDLSENEVLLIVDSEGLGSVEKDRELNIDLKIFTICCLISSTIIYNSKHSITEDKIEELSNVANLTNRIKFSNTSEETNSLTDCFPKLIWVLRDFSLDLKSSTPNDYLEKALAFSNNPDSQSKNESREIIKKNFKERECLTFVIPSNDVKVLKNLENEQRTNLRKEFQESVNDLITKIKNEKRIKIIQGIKIDGMTLLGLIQNFTDALNHNEMPVIMSSLESVLLSKASKLSETYFDRFKEYFLYTENKTVNNAGKLIKSKVKLDLPISFNEIINSFFDSNNTLVQEFSEHLSSTLSPSQIGSYIINLQIRLQDELFLSIEENNNLISVWLDEENDSIKEEIMREINKTFQFRINKKLTSTFSTSKTGNTESTNDILIETPEDLNKLVFLLSQNFNDLFNNKLSLFPDPHISKLLSKISKFLEENIFDKVRKSCRELTDVINNKVESLNNEITSNKQQLKKLKETINQDKILLEERTKEKNELYLSKLDLETKYDILLRELKNKDKEFTNNLNLEIQKYSKMEDYYLNLIKDKNNLLQVEEKKVNNLMKELGNRDKDLSHKNMEYSKEYSKLNMEIEKMKKQKETLNNSIDNDSSYFLNNDSAVKSQLQNIFKNLQSLYIEFKDLIDKCDKDKESLFRKKFFEISSKEMEKKSKSWTDEVILFRENHLKTMQNIYNEKLNTLKAENNELKLKVDKYEYSLSEESRANEDLKQKLENIITEKNEVNSISKSKDAIIEIQKTQIELFENKQKEWEEEKDVLEIKICQYVSSNRIKEDEIETMIMIIDSILTKNKKKFENHIFRFDDNISTAIQNLVKENKVFK